MLSIVFIVLAFANSIATDVDQKIFPSDKCTTIAVGKATTKSGSPMLTHTADCAECDWRVNKVPARDWPAGSMRPIWLITGAYPRQVREDRGVTWSKANLEANMPQRKEWEQQENANIIGYIPQVNHTYALIEGMYGIMNEHQVAIGESTCAARLFAAPVSDGGKALLEASELSQIALERSKTAREAILLMGSLAEQYGYYSAEWNTHKYGEAYAMGEGGEALTVADKDEAWMFHIIPDDTGAGAVWVAQRVPDNHVTVVANSFVIRQVIPNHPDFLYSTNLWEVAIRKGWYNPSSDGQLLDFLKVYAPQRYHPNYSNTRVWRILSLANPGLQLPLKTTAYADDYPFSVPLQRSDGQGLLTPYDLQNWQRDHYEGTEIDTTKGLAAGPYGDPNRFDIWSNGNMTVWEANEGEFPRTISMFRTSYSIVAEPRPVMTPSDRLLTRVWLCMYAPDMSTYTPLYIQATALPTAFITGTMQQYRTTSAFWNACLVGNYAARFYSFAIQGVRALQRRLDNEILMSSHSLEADLLSSSSSNSGYNKHTVTDLTNKAGVSTITMIEKITHYTLTTGEMVSAAWRDYFPELVTTYRDGFVIGGQRNATGPTINRMFYPRWWLETVGFFTIGGNKDGILFAPSPIATTAEQEVSVDSSNMNTVLWMVTMMVVMLTVGYLLGLQAGKRQQKQGQSLLTTSSLTLADQQSLLPAGKVREVEMNKKSNYAQDFKYRSILTSTTVETNDEEEDADEEAAVVVTKASKKGSSNKASKKIYSYQSE